MRGGWPLGAPLLRHADQVDLRPASRPGAGSKPQTCIQDGSGRAQTSGPRRCFSRSAVVVERAVGGGGCPIGCPYSSMKIWLTSSRRLRAPVLPKMDFRWSCTVLAEMDRRCAISAVDSPRAVSAQTLASLLD